MAEGNFSKSQAASVNFLFNEGNIYISDNHLCALWGWLQQCDKKEDYTFIHIDYHEDLKIPNLIKHLSSIRNANTFTEFLAYREPSMDIRQEPFLAWDTYILIAYQLFPNWFTEKLFLTSNCPKFKDFKECRTQPLVNCKDSTLDICNKPFEYDCSCALQDVLENICNNKYKHQVILNLDIDYFFDCGEYVRDSYWSNEKIDEVAELLNTAMKSGNVRVLTIAMSPECCSEDGKSNDKPSYQPSWGIMERLLRILTDNAKKEFITIMQEKTDINKNSQINENKN